MSYNDFGEYDSSDFPSIIQSLEHSKRNPLLIENLSNLISLEINGDQFFIQEPSCNLKDSLFNIFEGVMVTRKLPESEHYRPEITAKRIYNNANLWYIILLCSRIVSVTQYNTKTITYIPASELDKILKFIDMHNMTITNIDPDSMDLTNIIF